MEREMQIKNEMFEMFKSMHTKSKPAVTDACNTCEILKLENSQGKEQIKELMLENKALSHERDILDAEYQES